MGATGRRRYLFRAGDGLRAIAALMVLVFHCAVSTALITGQGLREAFPGPAYAVTFFSVGVYVFFALSGYLVGGPYVRAWLAGTRGPALGPYLSRRLRRVVPAFWVVSLLALAWFGIEHSTRREVALVFLFAQVYDWSPAAEVMRHAWTLDAELAFYVLVPLVFLAGSRVPLRARPWLLAGGLLGLLAAGAAIQQRSPIEQLHPFGFSPLGLGGYFASGLALAAVEARARARLTARTGRLLSVASLACALAAFCVLVALDRQHYWAATLCAAAVGGGIVTAALTWEWATGRAALGLDRPVPAALGRWSYGIYLIHCPVALHLYSVFEGRSSTVGSFALVIGTTLAITIPLAALSWRMIERPALELRWPWDPPWRRREPARTTAPHGSMIAQVDPYA